MEITIGKRKIGPQHPPFLVAELSGNHNGSLERALKLVRLAKETGVDAVKIQTYTADTITWPSREPDFMIEDPKSLWKGWNLYDLYQQASLPWEWHAEIFKLCRELNLICFSSPFDESAVDFLETFEVPCYKIASPEIVDLALIRKAAATKKPLIISTAASTLAEIAEAVEAAREAGCQEIALLKCTASYPASPADIHLRTLPHLSAAFNTIVGLSDHSPGIGVAIASIPLGASIIEKHFTTARSEGGVDSGFSLEPHEFKMLVKEAKDAWQALGTVSFAPLSVEKVTHSHRPSLLFVEDLKEGEIVQAKHMRTLRPAIGLPPKELETILGLPLKHSVKKGTAVTWNCFKPRNGS